MGSSEGEAFLLREPVAVEGAVEAWMTAVENEMSNSLRSITKEGVYCYANEERQEWITRVLGMVSLVGSQIWWTWEVRYQKYLMHVHHILLSKLHLTARLTTFAFAFGCSPTTPHPRVACVAHIVRVLPYSRMLPPPGRKVNRRSTLPD